jgi:multicomponent Na+:H+ antiporter subunit G
MNWLAVTLMVIGGLFLAISSIGLLRLPDFYTRAHAVGKAETLGSMLVLGGAQRRGPDEP